MASDELERDPTDAEMLDWLLWDMQPDAIGGHEIWESIPFYADETDQRGEYLKSARVGIRQAMREQGRVFKAQQR
jgi:hypothetical protein